MGFQRRFRCYFGNGGWDGEILGGGAEAPSEAGVDKWVERVVRERVELEELAFSEAKKKLATNSAVARGLKAGLGRAEAN